MAASLIDRFIPTSALRKLGPQDSPRVTNMGVFFDLVYVFSIIQLSHFLLAHESWMGALEALSLFAAVWWAWNYTAWATNWLNPDHASGRMLMAVLMGCALLMAVAIPEAYGSRAGLFVSAYVTMAVIRAGYMALVFPGQRMGQNYAQLCAWSAISGLFWVAGAVLPDQRVWLWIVAVLLDFAAPYNGFWLPKHGSTPMQSWPLRGLHLLERNQQVFIIALGESVLLLGGLLVEHPLHADVLAAAGLGFMLILSLWWIYFVHLSDAGEHGFAHSSDHTKLARAGLAYAHGVMACGAIVMGVTIEMILAHPPEAVHAPVALIAAAGPAIFLAGLALFHRTMAQKLPLSYLEAVLASAVCGGLCLMLHLNGLWLGAGVFAVMLALAGFAHGKAASGKAA